jgi:hypothetical protein
MQVMRFFLTTPSFQINFRSTFYLVDTAKQLSGEGYVKLLSADDVLRVSLAVNGASSCSIQNYATIRSEFFTAGRRMQISIQVR